jgi:hypothetical protein
MNVKSAVFERGFIHSVVPADLGLLLIGPGEGGPFGMLTPDVQSGVPQQLSQDPRHARLARSVSGLDAAARRGL